MIKHKIILIFLSLFCTITLNSCGGSAKADPPAPTEDSVVENDENTQSVETEIPEEELSSTDNTNACLYFANDAGVSAAINAKCKA